MCLEEIRTGLAEPVLDQNAQSAPQEAQTI